MSNRCFLPPICSCFSKVSCWRGRRPYERAFIAIGSAACGWLLGAFLVPGAPIASAQTPDFGPATVVNSFGYTDGGNFQDRDEAPRAAADGADTWIVVWSSEYDLNGTIGTDNDILFARSTDGGLSWSEAAFLNTDATTDRPFVSIPFAMGDDDRCPDLAADGSGHWVAAWQRTPNGGILNPQLHVARSVDGGVTWTPPVLLRTASSLSCPSIITDDAGTWILTTAERGNTFNDRVTVFARSFDNGASWTAFLGLSSTAVLQASPARVFPAGPSEWLAFWSAKATSFGQSNTFHARSVDNGGTWSPAAPLLPTVVSDSGNDGPGAVASDGSGNWVVAWTTPTVDRELLYSRSSDNGLTWSVPAAPTAGEAADSDDDSGERVATDGAGTWVLAWNSDDSLGGAIGGDMDVFFSVSHDAGATWSAAQVLNSYAATDPNQQSFRGDNLAQVLHDGSRWMALWEAEEIQKYGLGLRTGLIGPDGDIVLSMSGLSCGNGMLDTGEDCEDGNRFDRDCCSSTCTFEPADNSCTPDLDLCTADFCDGAGLCVHALQPQPQCRGTIEPRGARVDLRAGDTPDGARFKWDWKKGQATSPGDFDNPATNNDMEYTLCAYDASANPQPVLRATAPANGRFLAECEIGLCDWSQNGDRGFSYKDRQLANDGLKIVKLRSGPDGQASLKFVANGPELDLPPLPLEPPLVIQLRHTENPNACWGASFSTPTTNDETRFKAKGD